MRRRREGRRVDRGWRRSSARTGQRCAARIGWPPCSSAPCARSRPVAPRPSAAISNAATAAAPHEPSTTPAATDTVPSARRWPRHAESKRAARSSCPSRTSMSSSRCPMRSTRSLSTVRGSFTACSSNAPSTRSKALRAILAISAESSASRRCSTPGDRTSASTSTCTAW